MKLQPIFALATDTIWGLACLARDRVSVEKIFELKGRNCSQPLVLFTKDLRSAELLQHIPKELSPWLEKHWPGGLTLVSKALSDKYKHCHPLTDTIGLRIPNHENTLNLLKELREPLAVTSLNRSGEPPVRHQSDIPNLFPEYPLSVFGVMPEQSSESCIMRLEGKNLKVLRGNTKQVQILSADLPSGFRIGENKT